MKTTKRIINILMVLILAVTVGAPVAFAAGGSNEPEEPVLVPLTERTVSQDGYQMKFKKDVLIQDPLNANSEPLDMTIQIKRNYRKIKWKLARKSDSVDGYIVLRKKGNSDKYKQIAIVGPKKKSYKDKKIKSRNNADYTVVGYRKTKYGIRKMLPRECFNAQGFDKQFKLPTNVPDSKLYKQAGNSVVVPVINRIAEQIYEAIK